MLVSGSVEALVLAVFILATSIWVGGYVAIVVVARTASAVDPIERVAFFRSLGRSYLRVGLPALFVALITGGVLARDLDWGGLLIATVVVAAALLLSVAVAVIQARRMTRLRRRLLESPDNTALGEQVRRRARVAASLRAVVGVLSIALVVLGAFLAA